MKAKIFKYLIICLTLGCLASDCKKAQELEGERDISAIFTIAPEIGPVNTTFIFDAGESYYSDGLQESHYDVKSKWDFDYTGIEDIFWDTEESDEDIVNHVYTEAKTYRVLLHARSGGFNDTSSMLVVVIEATNTPPGAAFSIWLDEGYPMKNFYVDANLSWDNQDPSDLLEVRWDWEDDGTYDTEYTTNKLADHGYKQPGIYTIRLQVKDTEELTGEMTQIVTVHGPGGAPCPGLETVLYGPHTYNTVQIGDQCWLKENLKIGDMILGNVTSQNNSEIEKYCYNNNADTCEKYGGLYSWDEMMQYIETEGAKGICPPDWHIPTDEEWKILEGNCDSQYGVGDPEWDKVGGRGSDVGTNLRSQYGTGWNGGTLGYDLYGFRGLPAGSRLQPPQSFGGKGTSGVFWTSTKYYTQGAWARILGIGGTGDSRVSRTRTEGQSVRCLKND